MRSKPTAPCRVCSFCAVSTPGRGSSRKRAARLTPLSRAVAAAWLLAGPLALHAQAPLPPGTLPRGLQVGAGQASVATQGTQMTVRNTPGAILNWQGFSIGAQALVRFEQANAASKVLNRVTGQDPSQILGSLTSNGQVWLLNPNGVLFGQGARVDVASLVASTLRLNDNDFLAGRYRYSAADGTGTVRNEGSLTSAFGGQVVLLGERVENSGDISAPGGQVTLAAARSVDLVDTGLPNLSVRVQVAAGESLNLGRLMADGGTVNVYGAIVNQQGLVQADTLGLDAQGRIVLKAADTLTLGETSRTQAIGVADGTRGGSVDLLGAQVGVLGQAVVDVSGAAGGGSIRLGGGLQGKDSSVPNARAVYLGPQATLRADATGERGSGGSIILWSDQATRAYGTLSAHGARLGGDGGFVETSGGWLDARPARVDVTAAAGRGGRPGTWLLDPNDIRIVSVGAADTNISGGPNFTSTNDNSIITTATLAAALNAGNSVSVVTAAAGTNAQAGDIVMDNATLSVNPGAAVTLTLQASRDVLVRNSTLESTGQPLSLTLQSAGTGVGAIEISFSNISTAGGNITLRGTQSQQVPLPGGGVSAQAFPVAVGYDAQLQPLPSQLIQPQAGVVLYESQLNLGAGTLSAFGLGSLTAPDSVGIFVRDSSISAANIALSGWSPAFSAAGLLMNGCGECGGARITATQSLALQGGGQDGVRVESDATLALNAPGNPVANLSINGEGTQLGVVVDRSDFNTQISVVGGSLTIDGRSTDTAAAGTAVLITDSTGFPSTTTLDLGSAAGMQITGSAGSSAGVGVAISEVGIAGPAGGTSTIAAAPGRLLLDQLVLSGAGAYNLRGEGISVSNSQLTGAAGLNLQTTVSATTAKAGPIEVTASSLDTSAANAALRLEAVGGTAAQGDPAFARGVGISLFDSTLDGAGAGSTIVLNGEGSSSIGEGVVFGRTPMTATSIAITGRALFDSHGVLSNDFTGGAASVLTATNLSISGASANDPAAPSRVGVLLGNAVELRLSGRGSASISGDSVVLGDGAGTQPFVALGDAATFNVSSADSQRVRNALLDFSGGTGTIVTLRADSDNLAGGRVRLDQSSVRTGGGNFTASGVGVRRSATTVPSNTTSADGPLGVFATDAGIDAGGGTVTITGVAPNDGTAQVGALGNSGVGFGGTSTINGSAITISGDGGDRGRGVDVGATVSGSVLNLTANQITVSGRGADFNPSSGLAYEGVVLNGTANSTSNWLVNAGGSLNLTSTNSGMSVSGVNFDAGSMILRPDGKLNLANSTLDTSGDLSLLAQGSAGGSGSSLLSVSSTALTAGGLLQINGQASDAGKGVALLRGSYSGRQVSVIGTSSGGLGLGLVDTVGTPGITATLAGVSLVGSSGGTGTGVSFTGNWAVQSPTDISISTENGLPLLANGAGQRPTFNAGQRFLLENFSPLGLVVGPGLALDGALLSGALAGMAPTATATLRATGSANPLALRGPITVPSRLAIQADGIELQPGAVLTSTAPGDAIVLGGTTSAAAASLLNTAGAGVLSTPNGRWVVRASDPRQTTLGGLAFAFTAYNLAAQPWTSDAAGNLITPLPGNALGYAVATAAVSGQGLAGVQTRVYDSTTLLTLNPSTWALSGLVPGDSLVLSGVTAAQLADKNVGTAKPVTLDAGSLFAVNDAGGRPVFGYDRPTFSANVTPLSLPISGASVAPRVYDGSVVANLASLGSVAPLPGDSVAVGGTVLAAFSDKYVGNAKPVAASGFVPTGADAANYLLLPPTGLVGNITLATLTYGATPVTGTVGSTLPPLGGQVGGFVAGDTLSNSTIGLLAWSTPVTSAGPAGIYAITGGGLAALNYQFVQASGNATALTLRAPSASDPATTATTVATTSALVSVQVPLSMSTPTEGRVLDTTTTLTPTSAMATADGVAFRASTGSGEGGAPVLSGSAAAAAAAAAADSRAALFATREVASGLAFLPLDFSSLPRDEVQTLLAARARYKQSVFSRSVYRLQQDPSLADVRACRNEFELSSGICVITEFIKEQIQSARASLASSAQPHRELQRRVKQAALPSIERKMALLIGVNRYDDKEVPQLLGSVPDARAVRDLLDQKLGYETTVLENPTRASIIRAFNQLALDAEPNDSVIVYFAGHGVVVPINGVDTGFWLSSDVDSERPDTWLANADIARMIAAVGARQLMLVSDSCYSGSLVGKERVQVSTPNDAGAMLKRKAAVVMSSGGDEPVADQGKNGHSVFAWHFMRGLEGLDQWQVGGSIYERLRSAVFKDFPQTPQYGASRPAGHEGNTDFLFERRELEAAAPAVKTP